MHLQDDHQHWRTPSHDSTNHLDFFRWGEACATFTNHYVKIKKHTLHRITEFLYFKEVVFSKTSFVHVKFLRHNLCELHWITADFTFTCNLSSLNHETSSFVGHSVQDSDSVWGLQRMAGMLLANKTGSWPARIIEAALQNPQWREWWHVGM